MLEKLLSETGKVALAALLKATNTSTKVGYATALYDLLQRNGNIRDRVVIYILCTLAKRAREKRDAHERAEHNNTEMLKLAGQILMGEEEPILAATTTATTATTTATTTTTATAIATAQNQAMNNALNRQMQYNQLCSMSAYQGTSTCK